MAVNSSRYSTEQGAVDTTERNLSKTLVGDFLYDIEVDKYRQKVFLSRNMTQVLAFHERSCARRAGSELNGRRLRSSSRGSVRGPSAGSVARHQQPVHGGIGSKAATPVPTTTKSALDTSGEHETKPSLEAMSSKALQVKTQADSYDANHRRSMRRRLEKQHEDKHAQLFLDLCNIRKKLNFKTNKLVENERPRKRARYDGKRCYCHLTIWDNSPGRSQEDEPLVRKTETCEIVSANHNASMQGHYVEINLARPFTIHTDELKVPVKGKDGTVVLGMAQKYFLEMKIIPCGIANNWPPIPLLGKSEGDQGTKLGQLAAEKLQGALLVKYYHLPQAPEPDTPLSVFYLGEGNTFRTKYGLEVNSTWTKAEPASLRIKKEPQSPTLSASWAIDEGGRPFGRRRSVELERAAMKPSPARTPAATRTKVTYNIDPTRARGAAKEFRRFQVTGFNCPICASQKFTELDSLKFHFKNTHYKYKFNVEDEKRDGASDSLTAVVFRVLSTEKPRVRVSDQDHQCNKSWAWQAPPQPFSLSAYVDGDHSWIGAQSKKKASMAAATSVGVSFVATGPAKPDPIATLRRENGGFLSARHVLGFRPRQQRKFPTVKLRTLTPALSTPYTSISHRPITGLDSAYAEEVEEARSETDDEVDNDWYIEKHLENLDILADEEGWNDGERCLRKRWDRHLLFERTPHSRYLSDSLVRFVRKEKGWLRDGNEDVTLAFVALMEELKNEKVIDDRLGCEMWEIIWNEKEESSPAQLPVGATAVDAAGSATRLVTHAGSRLPESPELSENWWVQALQLDSSRSDFRDVSSACAEAALGLPAMTCGVCRKVVKRKIVRCSSLECPCPTVLYHVRCADIISSTLQLSTNHRSREADGITASVGRDSSWKCPVCLSSNAARSFEHNGCASDKDREKGKQRVGD